MDQHDPETPGDTQTPASPEPSGLPETADAEALLELKKRESHLQTQNLALKAQIDELKGLVSAPTDPPRSMQHLHLLQIQPVRDLLVILLLFGVVYLGYVLRPLTIPLLLALALAYLFEPIVRRMTASGRIGRPVAAITIIFTMLLVVLLPVGFAATYGTIQGVHYGRQLGTNLGILNDSVRNPRDEERKERVIALGRPWVIMRNAMVGADRELSQGGPPPAEETPDAGVGEAAPSQPPSPAPGQGTPRDADEELILPRDEERLSQQEATPAAGRSAAGRDPQVGQPATDGEIDPRQYARDALAWVNEWVQRSAASIGAAFGRQALGTGADVLRLVWNVISRSIYVAFAAFLILFFFFFFSVSYQRVLNSLADLIPKWKRARTLEMIRKMDGVVSGFVRGRLIIMCIQTVMFIIGYWAVGVPAALVVGLVIGVLSLVPYMSLIGIPLTIILMWLQPSPPVWWWVILAPTVVYFIVQLSDDYVWTPMIQGKATDMDIPSILFAVLAGGILAGFYGVLLAIPAAACIKILLKEAFWPRFKAWSDGRVKDFLPISRYDPTATDIPRERQTP
jgi:predicted PurR-regulated permease PerM